MIVDSSEEENAFRRFFESQHQLAEEFCQEHPDLEVVLGACLTTATLLVESVACEELSLVETHRSMMWQTMLYYQQQSALLIATGNIDAGLALLRLAAELARDISAIGNHEDRLDLWLHRRDARRRRQYRERFRFNDANAWERVAHRAYDLCSEWGVHGHVSDAMNLEPVGVTSGSGPSSLVILRVSDRGVLSALKVWLMAFAPLHLLCAETFLPAHRVTLGEPLHLFTELTEWLEPVLEAIGRRLDELRRDG